MRPAGGLLFTEVAPFHQPCLNAVFKTAIPYTRCPAHENLNTGATIKLGTMEVEDTAGAALLSDIASFSAS
jgi:hypothetical protein